MANEIGSLAVRIGADTTGFRRGLKSADRGLSGFSRQLRSGINVVGKYTAAITAAGVALGSVLVRQQMAAIDSAAKFADMIGVTTEELVGLQRAASITAGVADREFNMALQRMTRRIAEAAKGTGEAKDVIAELGLDAKALADAGPAEAFRQISDAMQSVDSQGERVRIAFKLFDSEGAKLVNTLNAGTEEINRLSNEASALGIAFDRVDAAKVEQANDGLYDISQAMSGIVRTATIQLAPIITVIADRFTDAAIEAEGFKDEVDDSFDGAIRAAGFVMDAIEGIRRVFVVAGQAAATFALKVKQDMIQVAEIILSGPVDALNALIRTANAVAGLVGQEFAEIQQPEFVRGIQASMAEAQRAVAEGKAAMQDTLMQPMPSESLRRLVQEAQRVAEQMGASAGPAASGGTGVDPQATEAERARIESRLEAIREGHMTELELLSEKFKSENEIIKEALENQLITEQDYQTLMEQQAKKHQSDMTEIDRKASEARQAQVEAEMRAKQATMGQILGNISTLMNTESRKMFEIGKAAAIANSVVSTYQGMSKALELGWPLGPIAAAAIGAQGFAQVASIRSQSFGGGGAGAQATGSNTAAVNAASQPVQTQQQQQDQGSSGRTVTVSGIDPDQMFSGRQMIDLINEAQRDGARLIVA